MDRSSSDETEKPSRMGQQNMKQLNNILVVGIACGWLLIGPVDAQQRSKDDKTNSAQREKANKPKPNASSGMTKAREAAALAFVREHHAELESLLIQLKESQPKQYEQAVRDLFRTSEKLASLQERDRQRHDLELKAWQARSRVQLLSATLLMSPQDKPTANKLKAALLDEAGARRKLLQLDYDRTTKRLERIEAQMESIDNNAEKAIDRQIRQLIEGTPPRPAGKTSTPSVD